MKKYLCFLLISIFVFISFAGCQQKNTKNSEQQGTTNTTATTEGTSVVSTSPTNEMPIVKAGEDVTLTAFIPYTNRVTDYYDNEFTKWLTEKTNVKFEFVSPPANDAATKMNLILNSGDYPDIIWYPLTTAQMGLYAMQKVFIPLDDLYNKYGYFTQKVFEQYPKSRDTVTARDGKMYALPHINDAYHVNRNGRLWVYMPWVEELNLEIPSTTEEFYEFLKAIKEGDPNKNGKHDEIPLLSQHSKSMSELEFYFMNSFMVYPIDRIWLDDNGKIRACYTEEGYKKGLEYLNRLYEEDLIYKESFTISREEATKIGETPEVPVIGSAPAHGPDSFTKKDGESGRFFEYLTIPPLEGPDGIRNAFYRGTNVGAPNFAITSSCKYPEVAFRVADFLYDPETTRNLYIGIKGENWEWSDGKTLAANGEPAVFKNFYSYGTQPVNATWTAITNMMLDDMFNISQEAEGIDEIMQYLETRDLSMVSSIKKYNAYNEVMKFYESKINYQPYVFDEKYIVPTLLYEEVDATELADLQAVIEPYRDEMQIRFITGDLDIDKNWNSYLSELKEMGIDRMLEIMQKSYDEKYGK